MKTPFLKNPPAAHSSRKAPWGSLMFILLIALPVLANAFGFNWFPHWPKTKLVEAHIEALEATPNEKNLVPKPLVIHFGMQDAESMQQAQAVAPLKNISKEVTEGVSVSPSLTGKWKWESDNELTFSPAADWLPGQHYTIYFDKSFFRPNVKLAHYWCYFKTPTFTTNIAEFKFYQHPEKAEVRQVIATVEFNYPVDTKDFMNKTMLIQESLNLKSQTYHLNFQFDDNKRKAYILSDSLPINETERYLKLIIPKGIKSLSGTDKTANDVSQNVVIPDASSYFKIENANISIVRNEGGHAEQILNIETTVGLTDNEMKHAIKAYLLPKDYPATSVEATKKNYAWQTPGEVTPLVLSKSEPIAIQAIPSEHQFSKDHHFIMHVPESRYVFLQINKGLHSLGNFVLSNTYQNVVAVPHYPKQITFLHEGSLLSYHGEKKLSVLFRGIGTVKFSFARVLPEQINQLVSQSRGSFNHPIFSDTQFDERNISQIFTEKRKLDKTNLGQEQYLAIDFSKYINKEKNNNEKAHAFGLFLLKAEECSDDNKTQRLSEENTTDPDNENNQRTSENRLVLITDLALVVKDNDDESHDLFVASINEGKPVNGATVSVIGKNGLPIQTHISDEQGHVRFTSLKENKDEQEPIAYLAKLGSDLSFIPYQNNDRELNYSKFDVGGLYHVHSQAMEDAMNAYLFSDRGLYRPGEEVHVGMIIKNKYARNLNAGIPLELMIKDPKGSILVQKAFELNSSGFHAEDFKVSDTAISGNYTVELHLIKKDKSTASVGSMNFKVAEFLPDRLRIKAAFSTENEAGWIQPKNLFAKINLMNLYGLPATNRKIAAHIVLTPKKIQFSNYPGYIFYDPLFDEKKKAKSFADDLAETVTNNQGYVEIPLNLGRFENGTYQLKLWVEGFEEGSGRSVAVERTGFVSPFDYLLGYKTEDDLKFLKEGSKAVLHFIAIHPNLQTFSLNNLTLQLFKINPISTLVKNEDGTYQYQTILQKTLVNSSPFAVTEKGVDYTLPTDQIGDYQLNIIHNTETDNNIVLSSVSFSVVGNGQAIVNKNSELTVKMNKSIFMPGELIELQIASPYSGSGLITIERNKVYGSKWFKTNNKNSIQTIELPKDFKGDGYVNIVMIRDWNAPEIMTNPLSYFVLPFSVNHDENNIQIDVSSAEIIEPGQLVNITYKANKKSKIIIYGVDEGILQVAKYHTPDPLSYFFSKHALQVKTQQTVDQILPKFNLERELSAVGGDGGDAELSNKLNPFKRKTDKPVVFWSGLLDADNKNQIVQFEVPDYFNGAIRLMAVAVGDNAAGFAQKEMKVRAPIIVQPNVPTVVAPGDEFEVTATITNNIATDGNQSTSRDNNNSNANHNAVLNSNRDTNANFSITTVVSHGLEIVGDATQNMLIASGKEKTMHAKIRAKNNLGSQSITIAVKGHDKSSKITSTISIRPVNPYSTKIISGFTHDKKNIITLNRVLYPEYSQIKTVVSTHPIILLTGLSQYLENYPYGCTEQVVSKAFPLLVMLKDPHFVAQKDKIQEKLDKLLQNVLQRQLADGSFSYWPDLGSNTRNDFASVYAMHFLMEARNANHNIPDSAYRLGLVYLKELAGRQTNNLYESRVRAYAIYLLTRNEMVTTNYVNDLQLYLNEHYAKEWKKDLVCMYLAATYSLLKSDKMANELVSEYQFTSPNAVIDNPETVQNFYQQNSDYPQYIYILAKHFPEKTNALSQNTILRMIELANSATINTLSAAFTAIALNEYGLSFNANSNSNLNSISIKEKLLDGNEIADMQNVEHNYFALNHHFDAKSVTVLNPNKVNYFYQMTISGFDLPQLDSDHSRATIYAITSQPKLSADTQYLEITREYLDKNGKTLQGFHLGEDIEVHIKVRSVNNKFLSDIAITDLLPGGFEIIPESIDTETLHRLNFDFANIREDRVIFFGNVNPETTEIIYKIRATNIGHYSTPPIHAEAMYNPSIIADSKSGDIYIN